MEKIQLCAYTVLSTLGIQRKQKLCFQLSVMSCIGFIVDTVKTIMTPQRHKAIFFPPGYFEQITLSFNMNKSMNFHSPDLK